MRGDWQQLHLALGNIIFNAVQAMEGKGTLGVSLKKGGEWAEVSFSDTGPGISPENMGRLFEPLFSTKAFGIGFGLAIAKMVCERHGGSIQASSEPGKGATFTLRLPLCKEEGHKAT
ncbi:MAG: ATP-binding protein [Chloroflexota bacterium]